MITIFPNISRSKGKQRMKFRQLTEHNMRNILISKIIQKCRKTSPKPFSKKSKLSIYLDQPSEISQFVFIACPSRALPKYTEFKVLTTCFYYKAFFLNEVQNQSPCLTFSKIFKEKYFSCYIQLTNQISLSNRHYFLRYSAIYAL